jgi:formylglycine-generating enzyme required for sulfatase activity
MCDELLTRHGMALPTEAQWEFACRAGTATPWSCGDARTSLHGHANVYDETGARLQPNWGGPELSETFDDGYLNIAPVGRFAPNPWGLFDMHGNVWEWCRDWYGRYDLGVQDGDGLRLVDTATYRVYRGGSFAFPAFNARCAIRTRGAPSYRNGDVGVRAARAVSMPAAAPR